MSLDTKIVMNWSSGKDAALAYHILFGMPGYTISHLLTTLSADYDRVFMHGVREQLLDMQAERMKLPLIKIKLPACPDDDLYKVSMLQTLTSLKEGGVSGAAFGDIFLDDLKVYREQQLAQVGIQGIFPLWKKDTRQLVLDLEVCGIEAMVVCVSERHLGKEYLGKRVGRDFLNSLPPDIDPCGENGEFHTFVYNAPFFHAPIPVSVGEVVHKTYKAEGENDGQWDTGFYFMDLFV